MDRVGVAEEGRSAAAAMGTWAIGSSGARGGLFQEVQRVLEELSLKNKEMTLEMEKRRRANEEVSHKNNELSLELENLKQNQVERDPMMNVKYYHGENLRINQEKQEVQRVLGELSLKNKEMTLEMEKLRRANEEVSLKNNELCLELEKLKKNQVERELTMNVHDGQVHEGSMSGNAPQEGWFDPDQLDRFIVEGHERQIKLTEIRKKLIEVFISIGHCGPIIGIKCLGEINEKLFLDAARSSGISISNAAKMRKAWQQKIQGHIWHPYKRITEDGPSEEVLDEEDEALKELKAHGQGIYDAVVDALKEMDKYNSSGRTIVSELWNYKEGRKATVVEAIDCLKKKMMEHEKEMNCNKRRRSPRSR
ncbi:unnamed protein product [Urochloa humidicola]